MASERSAAAGQGELPFDQRMARLEALVVELEAGELPLEQALDRYQEGLALLRGCHATLAGFRRRVEELSKESEAALVPMESEADVGSGSGAGSVADSGAGPGAGGRRGSPGAAREKR